MKLIKNIKGLCGVDAGVSLLKGSAMADLKSISHAFLVIRQGLIHDYGPMASCPENQENFEEVMDASGQYILPAWCDSHTHLVFAGSREKEYIDKINGLKYEEIAARGGGILHSADLLNDTSEDDLYYSARLRLEHMMRLGTASVEIKSGYSMTLEGEMKMLRVIRRLKESLPVNIKSTYLVHTTPRSYKGQQGKYVDEVIKKFIPAIGGSGLADYIDVFCEDGFFSEEETNRILECGQRFGMRAKVHANQLHHSGGVRAAVKNRAISADHLEQLNDEEIGLLKVSDTITCLLPTAAMFLRLPYPPARKLIDEGLGFALATDYNPGSSPSGNMPLLLSLACIQMKILPQEAITAATINGAAAMDLAHQTGSIDRGKQANLILTKPMSSLAYFTYSFGENLIDRVYIKGSAI